MKHASLIPKINKEQIVDTTLIDFVADSLLTSNYKVSKLTLCQTTTTKATKQYLALYGYTVEEVELVDGWALVISF